MSDVIQFSLGPKAAAKTSLGGTNLLHADIKMSDLYDVPQGQTAASLAHDAVTQFDPKAVARAIATEVTPGWSNQELSDLYRTHRLLALAGIATEIDRGLTDEGDPWFVFMDIRNEVFVHFGRFDGAYMISSQVHEKPVWGDSLADLVAKFSELLQLTTAATADRHNIVSIARPSQNKVLIHPAVALAALVWSIYLMSDDVAAAASSVLPNSIDDVPHTDMPLVAADIAVLPDLAQKSMITAIDAMLAKQNLTTHHDRETSLGAQIANLPSGLSMKAVGLGLSLAALAVGLPLIDSVSGGTLPETGGAELKADHLDAMAHDIKAAVLLMAETAIEVFQGDHADLHDAASNQQSPMVQPTIKIELAATDSINLADMYHVAPVSFSSSIESIAYPDRGIMPTVQQDESAPAAQASTISQIPASELLLRLDEDLQSVALTNISTLTTAEFTQLVTVNDATELIELLDDPSQPGQYATFDAQARDFLDFLLKTYDDVRVVTLLNEIIFINVDAFDTASIEDPIYARSWSFEDGGVISTVGLKSDMEIFHLAA